MAMLGVATKLPVRRSRRRRVASDDGEMGLPFETFWHEPTRTKVMSPEQLNWVLARVARNISSPIGRINIAALYRVFGLNSEQVAQLASAVDVVRAEISEVGNEISAANSHIDVTASLAPFADALVAKYNNLPEKIDWWVLADPARQHTASLNPRCEDPAQWYGTAYAEITVPTINETLETMTAVYESQIHARNIPGGIFDGACPICYDNIRSGEANSITMPCGHVMHWAPSPGCGGLFEWTNMGNTTCPICRSDFLGETELDPLRQGLTVSVNIAL
jgi:hypothetical protein